MSTKQVQRFFEIEKKRTKKEELMEFWESSFDALFDGSLDVNVTRICDKPYPQRDRCGSFWTGDDAA